LGVIDALLSAGGERIAETRFFDVRGRGITVPSEWLGGEEHAIGLSREEMDQLLLQRAAEAGVEVIQEAPVVGVETVGGQISGLRVRSGENAFLVCGDIFIDATGRSRSLGKLAARELGQKLNGKAVKTAIVGYKAHYRDSALSRDACEIYSFPGGYGGVNAVEAGLVNHCFFVKAAAVRKYSGDGDRITRDAIFANPQAFASLGAAERVSDWLTVAVHDFGAFEPCPAANLFSVGDAAAFIDPFTGSGILMALESAELLSSVIAAAGGDPGRIAADYRAGHAALFGHRFRAGALLRRAAFSTFIGSLTIDLLRSSRRMRELIARSTRRRHHTFDKGK
jgi:flavin-dependent dehydrogenase